MSNVSHPSIVLPVNVQLQTLLQPLNLKNMLHHTLYCTLTNIAQSQALSSLSIAPHSACLQVTSAVSQHLSNSSGQRVQQSVSRRDVTSSVNAFDCSTLAPQRLTQPANTRVCRPVHSVNASVQQVPTGNRSCSSVVSDPPKRSRRSREKPKAKSPSASANPDVLPRDRKRNRTTSQTNSRKQKSPDALPAQVSGTNRYKTELCRSFEESGICRYGEKCQFAHGRAELRSLSRHPKYKTELCRTFHSTAFCPYGQRCHFVHDEPRDDFLSPQSTDEDPLGNAHVQVRSRRETTQDFSEPSYSTNQSFCQEVETQELLAPSSLAVVATRSDDEGFAASCTPSTCSPVKSSYAINQLSWTKNASSVVSVSKSYSLSTSSDEDSGCPMYFSNSNNDLPHSYIADAVTRELDGATSCADDAEEQDQDQEPEVVVEEDDEDYGDAFAELGNAFQRLSLDRNNNVLDVNNNVSDVNVNVNNSVDESNYAVLPPGAEWTSYHHEVVHSPVRSRTHSQQDELETSVANEKRLPIFASLAGTLR